MRLDCRWVKSETGDLVGDYSGNKWGERGSDPHKGKQVRATRFWLFLEVEPMHLPTESSQT